MNTAKDSRIRRQAAWAIFESHLEPEQRVEAIWLLEKSYQKSDVNTLINYVSTVGERFGFSDETCRTLYYDYFSRTKNPNGSLPDDPLPMMEELRREAFMAEQPQVEQVQASPPNNSVFTTPLYAEASDSDDAKDEVPRRPTPQARQAQREEDAPTAPKKPAVAISAEEAKLVIFSFIMDKAVAYFSAEPATLFIKMMGKVAAAELSPPASAQFGQWMASPSGHKWRHISPEEMSVLVNLVVLTMCELIGKPDAEQILQRVVVEANSLVEAQSFSPENLL